MKVHLFTAQGKNSVLCGSKKAKELTTHEEEVTCRRCNQKLIERDDLFSGYIRMGAHESESWGIQRRLKDLYEGRQLVY